MPEADVAEVANGGRAEIAKWNRLGSKGAMSSQRFHIVTRDKPGLLVAMMRALARDACISFEGDLRRIDLTEFPRIDEAATTLRRQTITPELDFVVIPLTAENLQRLWQRLSAVDHLAADGIIHTQIETNGRLAFGAYDYFHANCVYVSDDVPVDLLEKLKVSGVIREFVAIIR